MSRLINAFEQFFDTAGNPLTGGKLYFYESGSSSALKDTYSDAAETVENTNPVILDADGRCPDVFGNGSYRVILKDSSEVQILTRDPVGGSTGITFGADWNSSTVYGQSDVVRDGGKYWISRAGNNSNNRPSTDDGANWLAFPQVEKANFTEDTYKDIKDFQQGKTINGNFDVWQEQTSSSTNDEYTADQWEHNFQNGTGSAEQVSHVFGQTDVEGNPEFGLRFNQTAGASDFEPYLRQRIEDVRSHANETITVSFYAKVASGTVDVTPRFRQYFGSGGSPSGEVETLGAVASVTTTWQRLTATVTLPSVLGKTVGTNSNDWLGLELVLPLNTAADIEYSQVQIDKGAEALPFRTPSKQQNLADCQRFFEKSYSKNTFAGAITDTGSTEIEAEVTSVSLNYTITCVFNTRKRDIPSVFVYSPRSGAIGKLGNSTKGVDHTATPANPGENSFRVAKTGGDQVDSGNQIKVHWIANARL